MPHTQTQVFPSFHPLWWSLLGANVWLKAVWQKGRDEGDKQLNLQESNSRGQSEERWQWWCELVSRMFYSSQLSRIAPICNLRQTLPLSRGTHSWKSPGVTSGVDYYLCFDRLTPLFGLEKSDDGQIFWATLNFFSHHLPSAASIIFYYYDLLFYCTQTYQRNQFSFPFVLNTLNFFASKSQMFNSGFINQSHFYSYFSSLLFPLNLFWRSWIFKLMTETLFLSLSLLITPIVLQNWGPYPTYNQSFLL